MQNGASDTFVMNRLRSSSRDGVAGRSSVSFGSYQPRTQDPRRLVRTFGLPITWTRTMDRVECIHAFLNVGLLRGVSPCLVQKVGSIGGVHWSGASIDESVHGSRRVIPVGCGFSPPCSSALLTSQTAILRLPFHFCHASPDLAVL